MANLTWKAFNPEEIKNFGEGAYESRLMLDSYMAGEKCINVNHGTVAPGAHTGAYNEKGELEGCAHDKAEIYIGMSGSATCILNGTKVQMKNGTVIYIPAGTHHCLENNSKTEKFCLLTLWPDENDNDCWVERKAAWGKTYKRADED